MYLDNITEELHSFGIDSEEVTIMKNGVPCTGIRVITGSSVSPVVYYSQGETMDEFVARINDAVAHTPDIDASPLSDIEFVLKNLYVSVQRMCLDENAVSKYFLNVEAILRIRFDLSGQEESGSIKATEAILKNAGITVEEAWEAARSNTLAELHVYSMEEALGIESSGAGWMQTPLRVATTESRTDGAAALLFPDLFRGYCLANDANGCIILPSSTQECLVILDDDAAEMCCDYDSLAEMVKTINETQVDPLIQMDPVVYRYDTASDSIRIVASAPVEGDD